MPSRRNREELGDRVGFCLGCGWGRRFMTGSEGSIPAECPACGGRVMTECEACGEPIESLMSVACRRCGEPLREPVLFGVDIRRKPEPLRRVPVDASAAADDNERQSQ